MSSVSGEVGGDEFVRAGFVEEQPLPRRSPAAVEHDCDFIGIRALVHLGVSHVQAAVLIEVGQRQRVDHALDLRDDHVLQPGLRAVAGGRLEPGNPVLLALELGGSQHDVGAAVAVDVAHVDLGVGLGPVGA